MTICDKRGRHHTHENTVDGLHVGAAAGAWAVMVHGYAGLVPGSELSFAPRWSPELGPFSFGVLHRGVRLLVDVDEAGTTYRADAELTLRHHGDVLQLTPGEPSHVENRQASRPRAPSHPAGRRPPLDL